MKSISLEQFEELLALGGWRHTQIVNDTGSETREEYRSGSDAENPECITSTVIFGDAVMTSARDGVTVTYSESWSYVKHNEDSFSHGEDNGDGADSVWTVTGVDVIDDSEVMTSREFMDVEIPSDFSTIDYSEITIKEVVDIDVDDSEQTTYLERDNEASIRFTGECIAAAASSDNNASGSSYSGLTGRWTELSLYKTIKGTYICYKVERTRWQDEKDHASGEICDNLSEVFDFYGYGWLAKDLYENGEINAVDDTHVDKACDMETHTIVIDDAPDIRFTGECIGQASSSDNNAAGSNYSGQSGRWTELKLYKIAGGKYICHQVGRTRWQGERDRFSGHVCETLDEVKTFFGHRWLAKELYADASIEDVQIIN